MKKEKILLILKGSALNRKMNTGLETLVWSLAEKGIEIHIVSGGGEPKEYKHKIPENVFYYFTGVEKVSTKNTEKAMEIIRSNDIDIIIGRVEFLLPFTELKYSDFKKPKIIAVQGSLKTWKSHFILRYNLIRDLLTKKINLLDFKYRFNFRKYSSGIDQIVAISHEVKNNSQKFYKLKNSKMLVIPCGVDVEKYSFKEKESINLNEGVKIMYAGNVQKTKGLNCIIEAVSKLDYKFELILCGNTQKKYLQRLRKQFEPKNSESRLIYKGPLSQEDLIKEYHNCDIFVFQSKSEGLGKALIEAMACGCPIISSDINTFKEFVVNKENGLMVPYNDSVSLCRAVENYIQNESLRKKCSFNARLTAELRYSTNAEVDPWLKIIKECTAL